MAGYLSNRDETVMVGEPILKSFSSFTAKDRAIKTRMQNRLNGHEAQSGAGSLVRRSLCSVRLNAGTDAYEFKP
jgi:hypothetical protein